MYKIATVTFHHAHNFGSVLQTYALQEYVKNLFNEAGIMAEYKIIDFHTAEQEGLYNIFKKGLNIKNVLKNMFALPYVRAFNCRYQKFEEFLSQSCNLTKRYKTIYELQKNIPPADCYISGSDQLWNVRAKDFSDVYYLAFVQDVKKISYAASFGPLEIDWTQYDSAKYAELLTQYSSISVREQSSADNVYQLIGKKCNVHVDPTLLLTADQWRKIQSDANYNQGRYILLYCLEPSKKQLKMAYKISKKFKLPIVITGYRNKYDYINPFIKLYDSGPLDFLSLIDNAALVLTSSFHGTAFSLLYHKPFYVLNGMSDNRIVSILKKTNMTERSLENFIDISKVLLDPPDGKKIDFLLEQEQKVSESYLKSAFGLV